MARYIWRSDPLKCLSDGSETVCVGSNDDRNIDPRTISLD